MIDLSLPLTLSLYPMCSMHYCPHRLRVERSVQNGLEMQVWKSFLCYKVRLESLAAKSDFVVKEDYSLWRRWCTGEGKFYVLHATHSVVLWVGMCFAFRWNWRRKLESHSPRLHASMSGAALCGMDFTWIEQFVWQLPLFPCWGQLDVLALSLFPQRLSLPSSGMSHNRIE